MVRMGSLIDTIFADCPGCALMLSNIPLNAKADVNKRVDIYNSQLYQLAKQREAHGQHIVHVDTHSAVALSDLNTDGIHPNDAAYERISQRWYDGFHVANLRGFIKEPSTGNEAIKCPVAFKA